MRPFTLKHWRAWCSDLVLDTGDTFKPQGFQDEFVKDLFAGWPECWLIVPEGNGKTTLLAALALYHTEHHPFAVVPVAAASKEQAEIMYRQAEGFVLRSPRMYQIVHSDLQAIKGKQKTEVPAFQCLEGYRRINHYQGGRIQIFAADDRTGDGVIPTLGIIDEPHRQRDLSLYRTWSGKLLKRDGQIAAISTSGEPGSDFELTRRRILDSADTRKRKGAHTRVTTKRVILHDWSLPEGADADDIRAVKRANPLKAITVPMLREKRESPTMTMHHWLRFVCNRPTMDTDTWLGPDAVAIWGGLTNPSGFEAGAPTWIGVDIALKRDTSAVVAVQRRTLERDGEAVEGHHAKCRIWAPVPGLPVDTTDIMQHLREMAALYDVQAISFDPRFFDVPAKYLEDEGLPMVEYPQSVERMTVAIGGLYEAIMASQLTHDADELFEQHILNAVPRFNDRGFTLTKSRSRGHIDAAIALSLAIERAQRQAEPTPSVYETRGVFTV